MYSKDRYFNPWTKPQGYLVKSKSCLRLPNSTKMGLTTLTRSLSLISKKIKVVSWSHSMWLSSRGSEVLRAVGKERGPWHLIVQPSSYSRMSLKTMRPPRLPYQSTMSPNLCSTTTPGKTASSHTHPRPSKPLALTRWIMIWQIARILNSYKQYLERFQLISPFLRGIAREPLATLLKMLQILRKSLRFPRKLPGMFRKVALCEALTWQNYIPTAMLQP